MNVNDLSSWDDVKRVDSIYDLRYMHDRMSKCNFISGGRGAGRSYMLKQRVNNEYIIYGVKELLSKPDLTPDEMFQYKIELKVNGQEDYTRFFEVEIQIEFQLRAIGYMPGEEKELKRIELLKDNGFEKMIPFWQRAMK